MDEEEDRVVFCTPFVNGDPDPVGIVAPLSNGALGAGVGASLGGRHDGTRYDSPGPGRQPGAFAGVQTLSMRSMFLRTRLHMWLLWSTAVFTSLAVLSALISGGSDDSSSSATTTTVVEATTTTALTSVREYTVLPGESLFAIAEKFNLSAPALVELNKIKDPDRVAAGTVLKLPPSNGFVPIGATTTMPP